MNQLSINKVCDHLRKRNVTLEHGLSDSEVIQIEKQYGFIFPSDLRRFLQIALPISEQFPNWRDTSVEEQLKWPFEGICFDIEHNNFWLPEWGNKPAKLSDSFSIAKEQIDKAPKLIPIYGHRFIPDDPREEGNPVFSVYQTDIIHYGFDLASYFVNEFGVEMENQTVKEPRKIRFWSTLCS